MDQPSNHSLISAEFTKAQTSQRRKRWRMEGLTWNIEGVSQLQEQQHETPAADSRSTRTRGGHGWECVKQQPVGSNQFSSTTTSSLPDTEAVL